MLATYRRDSHLFEALQEVSDPELPLSLVEMGLIYGVWQEGATVYVKLTFTAMGCPGAEFIVEDVRARLLQVARVAQVDIEIVWDPPWSKQLLSAEARATLAAYGIAV
jgi:metal-sulfur cluster biosynthetic enzyme